MAADTVRVFGAGIDERPAAFALEIRDAGLIHFEKDRAVENESEHQTFAINAGAAEHALHRHRTELREKVTDELGVQAGNPSSGHLDRDRPHEVALTDVDAAMA